MVPTLSEQRAKEDLVYNLDEIDGHQFEDAAEKVFRRMGYQTERGKLSNDYGRDIVLRKGGEVVVVECKHQRSGVGRPVVQKLHSATNTYGAKRGLILTTGSFAPSAREYAKVVTDVQLELWDYARLVKEARIVGVYFVGALHGTDAFFWVPWHNLTDAEVTIKKKHLASLQSSPRSAESVVERFETSRRVAAALIADSKVDRTFETQVGCIYNASHMGRRIYLLDERPLSPEEQHFWTQSTPRLFLKPDVDGRETATYFGHATSVYIESLRQEIAQQLSRTVRYAGRNNQQYQKFCEVRCEDVDVQAKQVLLARWSADFTIGPKKYSASFADDASRELGVMSAIGFDDGSEGFVSGNGFLCNDCGLISPSNGANAGSACSSCSRTLCKAHAWKWPSLAFMHRSRFCATCYPREHAANLLNVHPLLANYAASSAVSLIPGAQFVIAGRSVIGATLLLLFLGALFAGYRGYYESIAVLVCTSVLWSIHWTSRIRAHKEKLGRLSVYQPEWVDAN